jgi:hypothetical protein
MKIIEMYLQFALRIVEMLARVTIDLIVALLKGGGKLVAGLLGGLSSARGRQPKRPQWQQHKVQKGRRRKWRNRHPKAWR